jgi:hypothetical protein
MSKIDWTKRRLFSDIPGQADSDLVDLYEGTLNVAFHTGLEGIIAVNNWHVYVLPNKAIFGGSGEEGWVFLLYNGMDATLGYSPSKVYKSLPQCIKQAEKSFLVKLKETVDFLMQ